MHRLAEFSLRRPWLTLGVLLVITGVLGAGVPRVKPAYGFRVLIGADHPAIQALDSLIDEFAGGYPARIAWKCGRGEPCNTVFDAASLEMADALTQELAAAAPVMNVLGPANAPVLVSNADGFAVRRFVENGVTASDARELAQRVLDDPLWVGTLVSPDGHVGVIVVQPADNEPETDLLLTDTIDAVLEPFRAEGFSYHLVGDITDVYMGRALAESTNALMPVMILVIGALLYLMTRSWQQSLVTLATMGVGFLWTLGALGWLGWPQDGMLEVLPVLVVIVGVCDAVHLLSRYAAERSLDPAAPARGALLAAARDAGPACVITTLTSAGAFASFTVSNLDTFIHFGVILPVGILACLLLTFSLLPIAITWLPTESARSTEESRAWRPLMDAVLATSSRRSAPLLAASALLLAVFGYGWAVHLHADTDWLEAYGESSPVVQAIRFVEDSLGSSETIEVDVRLPPGTQIEDPATLATLSDFSQNLSRIDGLGEAESVLDLIERVNRILSGDAPEFERPGDSLAANAELLELIGFDDPETLGRWLSLDRSRLRVSLGGAQLSMHEREAALEEVHRVIRETLPSSWQVQLTGEFSIEHDWVRDVQATQLRSFPIAFAIVFVLGSVFLRSWRLGLAAMVPTLLPVIVVLGAMGWLGMSLDVARAMIAAVVIGIGVDDSMHVLAHYKKRRDAGDNSHNAMRAALRHSGRAVVTTSGALALGFLTLMMSAWQTVATFGFFVALSILGALAATLLVLPALVFAFAPRSRDSAEETPSNENLRSGLVRSGIVLLPLVVASLVSLGVASQDERPMRSPCWILPEGHVMTLPGWACPLQFLDQIRWVVDSEGRRQLLTSAGAIERALSTSEPSVPVGILRRGEQRVVDIELVENTPLRRTATVASATVIAAGLMILPVLLLLYSRSRAALPLAVFYSAIGVAVIAGFSGQYLAFLNTAAIIAMVVAPAAIVQIGMVFPSESTFVRHSPHLYQAPYAISALLGVIALFALNRAPVLWPTFIYLLLLLSGIAWLVVLASCWFAVRESTSPSSRSRAGFVVVASLVLPAIVSVPLGWETGPAAVAATYLWTWTLLLPVPIAFAISRFNLFDVGWHVRRGSARIVYFMSTALFVSGLIYLGTYLTGNPESETDFGLLFIAAFGCLAAGEALRRPLFGFIEAALSPRTEELRLLRDRCSGEMAKLQSEHEISRLALSVLMDGIHIRSGWISLRRGAVWEAAQSVGDMGPPSQETTLAADERVASTPVAYLETEDASENRSRLMTAGINLVARIAHGDERLGLVLLNRDDSRPVLSGFELEFVASVASQAAIAIHNSRLADERAAVERDAATARLAVDLVHDVGKDLGWMRGLANRLAEQTSFDDKLHRGASQVGELADALVERMKAFLQDATATRNDSPSIARVDELIERSLRSLIDRSGVDKIRISHDPTIRRVRCHENVGRVLFNLVDNAIQASDPPDEVRVAATMSPDGWLVVSVEDSGCGIPPGLLSHVMEPGFTTRRSQGGVGVGLSLSRELTEALGGKLELSLPAGGGVRAEIQVPIPESWRTD